MKFEISELYESAALYLLALALGNNGERDFAVRLLGRDVHLKVLDATGAAVINVVGKELQRTGRTTRSCMPSQIECRATGCAAPDPTAGVTPDPAPYMIIYAFFLLIIAAVSAA